MTDRNVWHAESGAVALEADPNLMTLSADEVADLRGQVRAINLSQSVIEFDLDGTILHANENFLSAMGYSLAEVKHRHHRMFVGDEGAARPEYQRFWADLRAGRFQSGEFKRFRKGGTEILLQATYTPINDPSGRPYKVVKYATDITTVRTTFIAVAQHAAELATSSTELAHLSEQMGSTATQTSSQATNVSQSTDQVSRHVQTVADSAEELTASIREIAKNAAEAARVASQAVERTMSIDKVVTALAESGAEIGKVIKVINGIAQQTNLLALNATIEAARAGASGKGFAVVATEVKELAKETAKATDHISQRIEAIQADTRAAAGALRQISDVVGRISDLQSSIASAVEQQTATTNEMSRSITEGAQGIREIARNIQGVGEGASSTRDGAVRTQESAAMLERLAEELRDLTIRFTA